MKLSKLFSSIGSKLRVIGTGFAASIIWLAIVLTGLKYLINYNFFTGISFTEIGIFFFACIFAPLWEELAFRHAPLQIAKKLSKPGKDLTWPVVILSSTIFGWGHGAGPISLLIQGVGGLILSWVYIKANYSYWSSVTAHALWNFSLMYIFPTFTETYGIKVW